MIVNYAAIQIINYILVLIIYGNMEQRARRTRSKPIEQIRIAKERIDILFDEAKNVISNENSKIAGTISYNMNKHKQEGIRLANRYVQLARKIGMRYNVLMPTKYRKLFCRKCKRYLYSGITSQQRLKNGFIKIKCLSCNKVMNYSIKKS